MRPVTRHSIRRKWRAFGHFLDGSMPTTRPPVGFCGLLVLPSLGAGRPWGRRHRHTAVGAGAIHRYRLTRGPYDRPARDLKRTSSSGPSTRETTPAPRSSLLRGAKSVHAGFSNRCWRVCWGRPHTGCLCVLLLLLDLLEGLGDPGDEPRGTAQESRTGTS